MKDKRGRRPWVKVQLADQAEAHEAAAQVMQWKAQRQAAAQVVRAIRLYAALLRGDLTVLETYFPGLTLNTRASMPSTIQRPVSTPPSVILAPHSEADEIDDALDGIGLDDLDF